MQIQLTKNKQSQREYLLSLRKNLSCEEIKEKSKIIIDFMLEDEDIKKAKNIFLFASLPSEVQIFDLIKKCLKDNKNVAIPFITDSAKGEMVATKINSISHLTKGYYNILTAKKEELAIMNKEEMDVVIVPALALDKDGHRMGLGKGFYDRFLKGIKAKKIAPIFSLFVIDNLIYEGHDALVDKIYTERGVISCGQNHY